MNMWLMHSDTLAEMRHAHERGMTFSPEQVAAHSALVTAGPDTSRVMQVAGRTAAIGVTGVLTETPSFMAYLMGGGNTTYAEIRAALAEADADPEVDEIILNIDSPGGNVAGLFDTVDTIVAATTPITARVANLAASAAFAIMAVADKAVATNRAATFGSVGIAQTFYASDDEVTVTSTNAPNKVPDVKTEAGVAVVRAQLDDLHELFVESIAAGRGLSTEKVNADFGQGGVFLANEALKRGMIDEVKTTKTSTASEQVSGNTKKAKNMNQADLQAQHPELYAAVLQAGVTQERDRVSAHLVMGAAAGIMDTAVEAINSGAGMTATLQAQYMAAGMNKGAVASREADETSADPGAVTTDADPEATAKAGLADILARAGALSNLANPVEM